MRYLKNLSIIYFFGITHFNEYHFNEYHFNEYHFIKKKHQKDFGQNIKSIFFHN